MSDDMLTEQALQMPDEVVYSFGVAEELAENLAFVRFEDDRFLGVYDQRNKESIVVINRTDEIRAALDEGAVDLWGMIEPEVRRAVQSYAARRGELGPGVAALVPDPEPVELVESGYGPYYTAVVEYANSTVPEAMTELADDIASGFERVTSIIMTTTPDAQLRFQITGTPAQDTDWWRE